MADPKDVYENLGVFYLGRPYDLEAGQIDRSEHLLYDSKDLVTHAVCVGMTGSGKTGLGVTILEEAALDGIPALVVDPKGDLTNLLLNFPELRGEDFAPWINADDAAREGKTLDQMAADKAAFWKQGLADWDQDPARIKKLGDSCEFSIFTPGSDSGIPLSILSSFEMPPQAVMEDTDLLRDRISTTATSLLALLGIDADPIRSREHILLTTIFDNAWRQGQGLDLGSLIRSVQSPPVQKVGVMELESFYPSKERFELAMAMNNLLASPSFSAWMHGHPLDAGKLLYTPTGKPRVSIFYIAHLSEAERMFFMSLLLNQVLGWMRSRGGTSSLRALLYIDEIFGYMPPVAEPPSKKPLLTLLKQARAYGVGLVLATQNPADLDYKGLSNTGTWFLGRLQTERDRKRVLDGLEGVSSEVGSGFDRATISETLSKMGKRVFLMHNVHEPSPTIFHTRWALSYLAGPMTRTQIRRLTDAKTLESGGAGASVEKGKKPLAKPPTISPGALHEISSRPVLPPGIPQVFLPLRHVIPPASLTYRPAILALCKVHFVDTRKGLFANKELAFLLPFSHTVLGVDWSDALSINVDDEELSTDPAGSATFAELPTGASQSKSYAVWKKSLADYLYRSQRYPLFRNVKLKLISEPGESEREFKIRLAESGRELRDEQHHKLRRKYAKKLATIEERIRKAEMRLDQQRDEAKGARMQNVISLGATVLRAVLGRKRLGSATLGRATSTARGWGRTRKQEEDVFRARSDVEAYHEKLREMEDELQHELVEITRKYDEYSQQLTPIQLKPRKTDILIRHLALAWVPYSRGADDAAKPLFP